MALALYPGTGSIILANAKQASTAGEKGIAKPMNGLNWSRIWLLGLVMAGIILATGGGPWLPVAASGPPDGPSQLNSQLNMLMVPSPEQASPLEAATPDGGRKDGAPSRVFEPTAATSEELWYRAVEQAGQAAQLAQTALYAQDWDQVMEAWSEAIALLQAIPSADPRRLFTQRKVRDYLNNLQIAQQQAERRSLPSPLPLPSLGSDILDEQIRLYRSYVATVGPPDVLIMGSSRALQGIDPQGLQQGLAERGLPNIRAYNFSVNGATAQVVSFILRQLLTPELYPKVVVWATGSRAFNSGRFDRTFAEVLASPGYAQLQTGQPFELNPEPTGEATASLPVGLRLMPPGSTDAYGFMPVDTRFNPATYYLANPRVTGRYDNAYQSFSLSGVQTVSFEAIVQFLQSQNIPLILVNLPLSNDYLDSVRLGYERAFQGFLQAQSRANSFLLLDLLELWRNEPQQFADPSHLNRYGAVEIARRLAADPRLPWSELARATTEAKAPVSPQAIADQS